jgi:hypothetical protein
MKKIAIIIAFVAVIACIFALRERRINNICGRALLSNSFYLNEKQIKKQKALADQGDGAAAHTLYWYYASYKADNYDLSMYWLIRAAEYNDCDAQCLLGGIYLDFYKNDQLARFWLTRAIKNGSTDAKELLNILDEKNKPQSQP